MKRLVALILTIAFAFSLAACDIDVKDFSSELSGDALSSDDAVTVDKSAFPPNTDIKVDLLEQADLSSNTSNPDQNSSAQSNPEQDKPAQSKPAQNNPTQSSSAQNTPAPDNTSQSNPEPITPTFTDAEVKGTIEQLSWANVWTFGSGIDEGIFTGGQPNFSTKDAANFVFAYLRKTVLSDCYEDNTNDRFSDHSNAHLNVPIARMTDITKKVFGKDYDFTKLGPKASDYDRVYYDADNQWVVVVEPGHGGPTDDYVYISHTASANDTAEVVIEYYPFYEADGGNIPSGQKGVLTIKKHSEGLWQIVNFKRI